MSTPSPAIQDKMLKQPLAQGAAAGAARFLPSPTLLSTAVTLLFYTSMTAFILFLVLTFIHYTIYPIFSFSEADDGFIRIPTASDQQKAFQDVVAVSDISANFVSIPNCGYTVSFDTFLSGEFLTTGTPRVLLYRSRNPVAITAAFADSDSELLAKFPDTNLLVYFDPIQNDMTVAVITTNAGTKHLKKVPAIENVPIRKVFRTTIVFTETFIEVYLNGKLAQSMPITEAPMTQDANKAFYTTPLFFGTSVKLANLYFWPRPLLSRDVQANGAPIASDTLFTKPAK
jgi:hypothetical protein